MVNRVILIGNLGADPEIRAFPNGGKVANLRIATSESWKDKTTGERKERTEWHSVAIMSEGLVSVAERFLRKGSKVYVEGQLETRKWQDQSGNDRYSTEVVLRPFSSTLTMLDAPGSNDDRERQQAERRSQQSARQASYDAQRPSGGGRGYSDGIDESEVPF